MQPGKMDVLPALLTVAGLALFETISSIDNAIINAEVLSTMGQKARRWFLLWGLIFAVFLVRGGPAMADSLDGHSISWPHRGPHCDIQQ